MLWFQHDGTVAHYQYTME